MNHTEASIYDTLQPLLSSVDSNDQELFSAIGIILKYETASVAVLQRRMHLKYIRASQIIGKLESMGIIGPYKSSQGSESRDILITKEQWDALSPVSNNLPECTEDLSEDETRLPPSSHLDGPQNTIEAPFHRSGFIRSAIDFFRQLTHDAANTRIRTNSHGLHTTSDGDIVLINKSDYKRFLREYQQVYVDITKVAGVSFKNKNNTSRQKILSKCRSGDFVNLEFFRYNGEPAYAVHTIHGQIGNLPADKAHELFTQYSDYQILCEIHEITGGNNGEYYGCNLILRIYQKK